MNYGEQISASLFVRDGEGKRRTPKVTLTRIGWRSAQGLMTNDAGRALMSGIEEWEPIYEIAAVRKQEPTPR